MNEHQENVRLQDLCKQAEEDSEYQQLRQYILNGFPDHRSQLPDECKRYWSVRNQLALDDNLIVYGCRVLIPSMMRRRILQQLHESHQGSVRTKQRARLTVYWPGISTILSSHVNSVKIACHPTPESRSFSNPNRVARFRK